MKGDIKSSSKLADKLMDCNKSDLPKGSCTKIAAIEKKFLNTEQKVDSSLIKKSDPDKRRVEELSAKEQESRRKFKEKLNKLKKMPMPPQPTINVNSEGLTEGELTIENVKRKFKQIFSKFFKESLPSATPELEKTVEKKQANNIKVCVGTKPVDSAVCRFACVLPMKRNTSTGKDIESMLCKSVNLLPEQYVNNDQIVFLSKDKQRSGNSIMPGDNDRIILPSNENEKGKKNDKQKQNLLNVLMTEKKTPETDKNMKLMNKSETSPKPSSTAPTKSPFNFISISKFTMSSKTPDASAPQSPPLPVSVSPSSPASKSPSSPAPTPLVMAASSSPIPPPPSSPLPPPSKSSLKSTSTSPSTSPSKSPSTPPSIPPSSPTPTPPPPSATPSLCPLEISHEKILPKNENQNPLKLNNPTIDLAPDDKPKMNTNIISPNKNKENKQIDLIKKGKIVEPEKKVEIQEPMEKVENVRGGTLANFFKKFDYKIFKPKSWFSGSSKDPKMKMIPFPSMAKIPFKWRQGVVIIGTFIPLYYTYHKIANLTENQLALKITEEN